MKYIVDRRKWYRGKGGEESYLLSPDDQLCCIGFVGQQCNIPDNSLKNFAVVAYRKEGHANFPAWMRNIPTHDSPIGRAYEINDNEEISDAKREARLKALFIEQGDEIEFIN